jgi:hypothetical protein
MKTIIDIERNNEWERLRVYNDVTFDERLDEQFDTGSVQVVSESVEAFPDFSIARITQQDGESEKVTYFAAFDTVEKRAKGYYIHALELVEPTRLLMGILIDGRKVTQPIEGSGQQKKTLLQVTQGLLNTFELLESGAIPRIRIADSVRSALNAVISPEFGWETETSLWECLCDIANVINAMPRLLYKENSAQFELTFDMINEVTGFYEL